MKSLSEREVTKQLRALIERPERRYLWGQPYTVTPRLIAYAFGDGARLLCVSPIATRPNYFVVRVDSSTKDPRDPFGESPWGRSSLLDDIMDAQEDEYGHYQTEYDETGDVPDWPIVDWGIGCTWGTPFPIGEWKPAAAPPWIRTGRQRTRALWAKRGRR